MPAAQLLQPVRFVEADHQYFIGNRELVPTTRALEIEGFVTGQRWFTDASRIRGTQVHDACLLDDQGLLDEDALYPSLRGYVEAERKAKRELGITCFDHAELALGCPILGVGGKLDAFVRGLLIDRKTGDEAVSHPFQTALYALLAERNGLVLSARRIERCCLYLNADGTYRFEWHRDVNDLRLAKSVAEVAVYKVAHGLAPMRRIS